MQERQKELSRGIEENKVLESRLQEIGSELYVEKVARDTLGLVKDGEAIVILPGTGSRNRWQSNTGESLKNWQKWWKLFF
jgi:cell division protein FtsB